MAKGFPNVGVTTGLSSDRTGMTSPFTGQIFFETDTNKTLIYNGSWVEISDLDSADGASASAQTKLNNIGLYKVATGTLNAQTTNITNCFSAAYTNYRLMFFITNTTLSVYMRFRLLSGTTPYTGGTHSYTGPGINTTAGGNNSTYGLNLGELDSFVPHINLAHCYMDIMNPYLNLRKEGTLTSFGQGSGEFIGRTGSFGIGVAAGSRDGLQVYTSDGTTVLTGTYWIFGYNY